MQNRISSNTNLICFSLDKKATLVEIIPLLAEGGYSVLDINLCEMMNPGSDLNNPLKADSYINRLLALKGKYNLDYHQSHLPYTKDYRSLSRENKRRHLNQIKLSLEHSEKLGISIAVCHPIKGTLDDNLEYFDSVLSYLPSGVKLAIENMESEDEIGEVDELLELIRHLHNDSVGICLDTGHAYLRGEDIPTFIKKAGNNLIATHIQDTLGEKDDHLLPGFGVINWEEVIPALKTYYNGTLNYEAFLWGKSLPFSLVRERIDFSLSVSSWLLSL